MNTPNNKRRKDSQEKIERTFIHLIQTREIENISVSDICKLCNLNRSTFYANYIDIYDLADKVKDKMISDFFDIYDEERKENKHSYNFLKLFTHIKENQIFYKTYFKLTKDSSLLFDDWVSDEEMVKCFGSNEYKNYHIEFFKAGLNAVLKKWLDSECKESPEEIDNIIKSEYKHRKQD